MRCIALNVDTLDAAIVQEVIDVSAAHGARQHAVDVAVRQAQRRCLAVINVKAQLAGIFQIGGAGAGQLRAFAHFCEHLVTSCQQGLMADTIHVLEHEVVARARTQPAHGRRQHHQHAGITNAGQILGRSVGNGGRRLRCQWALIPGAQAHKATRRALIAAQARDLVEADHIGLLGQILAHLVQHFLQAGIRRASGQVDVDVDKALIFIGQERGWQLVHQQPDTRQNRQKNQHHALGAAQAEGHSALIAVGRGIKAMVEPAEKAVADAKQAFAYRAILTMGMTGFGRLEQGGAQRRRQRQRHKHGKRHGRHDGDRELAVNHTGRATKKGHGHKHRRQRHPNTDQGRGDFLHGLAGCLLGRKPGFVHHPLYVFHHHNRIVHQQANGQHHGKHGQCIDGITRH